MLSIPRTNTISLAAALSLVTVLLSGCDNPLCVYAANGCQDGGNKSGGLGSQPAAVPGDGAWIHPDDPVVDRVLPDGPGAHPSTPIVVLFTESIAPGSTGGAFEVIDGTFGVPVPILEPPPVIGDGRVVVLSPLQPLELGATYVVRLRDGGTVSDLTGQTVVVGSDRQIGTFEVAASAPTVPRVIATWPRDTTIRQSDQSQVVAVFDRPMDGTSFDTDSFAVTVDGNPPAKNPDPEVLTTGGAVPITIPSVWHWTSVGDDGRRVSLGSGVEVAVDLSQGTDTLRDESGNVLPPTFFTFDLADFAAPVAVRKSGLSAPDDAIGRESLEGDLPVLEVEFTEPVDPGDTLELYVIGSDLDGSGALRAFGRTVSIDAASGLVDVLPERLDMLSGGPGSDARIADGDVHIAVALRRNGVRTALRMADADETEDGVQPLWFDVTPPKVLGLGTSGTSVQSFASDLRNMVIVGRANEEVREVEVTATGGADNADGEGRHRAIFAADSGLFVAAPVAVGTDGLLDLGTTIGYTVVVRDRALNAASAITGQFRQVGGVGPGAPPQTTGSVLVQVVDGATLAPISGARVMSHQDDAGVVTDLEGLTTDAGGMAEVLASIPVTRTLVTVDAPGYDLFTFHGLEADALVVPLRAQGEQAGETEGEVTSPFPLVNFSQSVRRIGDSRRADNLPRLFPVDACSPDPADGLYRCPFGPTSVRPRRLGAQTFLAYDGNVTEITYNATTFLRGFALRAPTAPIAPGGLETDVELYAAEVLASADPDQQPIDVAPQFLDATGVAGLGTLDTLPVVTVEGISDGLPGSVPVGVGVAFEQATKRWGVRAAYSGRAASELPELRALDPDLALRVEVVDVDSNRVGARPRFTQLDNTLSVLDVPTLESPVGSVVGPPYTVVVHEALRDAAGIRGLVRVQLSTPSSGRRWVLWTPDPVGDPGSVTLFVPNIATLGGTPLQDGTLFCRVSTFAWTSLDTAAFAWTDVDRLHEVFCHAAEVSFEQQ